MKNGVEKQSNFQCGFLVEKWRQVGTNINPKSMCTSKSDVLKKLRFSLGKTILLKVLEVKVGTKNRSKIDQKMSSTSEGLLASIFEGFWWIFGSNLGGQIHQKSMSKGIKKMSKVEERLECNK